MNERQIKYLLQPAAYPDPVDAVELLQTHVSWIFLAGGYAYKIKKPVNFGFLDFSTFEKREFYCHEEVRLNSRLTPELYLGVTEVREAGDGAAFFGDGRVIDHAVKMVRLPGEQMADRLLARGELTAEAVKQIAARVARFHHEAARNSETDSFGSLEMIRSNWEENFAQADPFCGITIEKADLVRIRLWVSRFMAENAELFDGRISGGFIRECDGDIHLENICLTDKVQIFDCIEFNERFRFCDTAADIAFPLMDLEFGNRADLAAIFLQEYLAASCDTGLPALIDFYRVYRAFIRGKVESFRLGDSGIPQEEKEAAKKRAVHYFNLAAHYLNKGEKTPALFLICGLSGSGKSRLAGALAVELGLEILSSDIVRKELAGIPLTAHMYEGYGEGLYSRASSEATYTELVARAGRIISFGRGMILDATFKKRLERESLRQLARSHGIPLFQIMVQAPEELIRERLEQRSRQGGVSDAKWEIYLRQKEEFEPLLESEGEWLTVDSSATISEVVSAVLRHCHPV
ncbi:MAG: AAA family ATPase [Geobacteraceae bacterium]|nr:AAA family ATPase [Geobacteraceae bacterium]